MKTLILLFTSLVLSLSSISQLTYVPDDNFEAFIENNISTANDGTPNNNYVLTSGLQGLAASVVVIDGGSYPIVDLTGIEDFSNIDLITFDDVPGITSIDLSSINYSIDLVAIRNCTFLQTITLPNSTVDNLEISANPSLQNINPSINTSIGSGGWVIEYCNYLASIDLSTVNVLGVGGLSINNNTLLNYLNIANGGCHLWGGVGFSDNPSLFCIQVDDPSYSQLSTSWWWVEQIENLNGNPNYPGPYMYVTTGNCGSLYVDDIYTSEDKELIRVTDFMGRQVEPIPNTPLIYHYSDGSIERVFQIEE